MSSGALHAAEYVVFGLLTVSNIGLGLYFSFFKKNRGVTTDELFLGNRSLQTLPLALSVLATMMSALGLIGFTAHYYSYGMHMVWMSLTYVIQLPFTIHVIIPQLYGLRVTSVFEYLKMRYGAEMEITACTIFFLLTESLGATTIFATSMAISTIFKLPVPWSSIAIGVTGTIYTALGGLRGVVWTDCMQTFIILTAPTTIIAKVVYDSYSSTVEMRELLDIDWKSYILESKLDFTHDENIWSCVVGLGAMILYRHGMDQMIVQRYLASRTIKDAQKTAYIGVLLTAIYLAFLGVFAGALVYWFRDCDPMLTGAISNSDQIVPYYVVHNLANFPGFSGLFLAGVTGATTSTISSMINSQATVCYVDIVSKLIKLSERQAANATRALAFLVGTLMSLYALIIPYVGSASAVFLVLYSGITGPFVGIFLLALGFPWANTKGAAVAALSTTALQLWHSLSRLNEGNLLPRMPMSVDLCPDNATL
ncbi:unnamed protein product, partial [Ixodes hexagonus]